MNDSVLQNSSSSPLVSVVLPVKNGENYLAEAIKSVLNQTFDDFELLICINPSSDNTVGIASNYLYDNRVRIISFENVVGISANFDRASKFATGKYIKYLCHDDILLPNCLKQMVQTIENLDVSMVCSYEEFLNSNNKPRTGAAFGNRTLVSSRRSLLRFVRHGNWIGSPTGVLLRNQKQLHFQETLNCAWDQELWTRVSLKTSIGIVPEILYLTRIHAEQQTSYCQQGGFEVERQWILREMSRFRGHYPLWINLIAIFFRIKEFGLYR